MIVLVHTICIIYNDSDSMFSKKFTLLQSYDGYLGDGDENGLDFYISTDPCVEIEVIVEHDGDDCPTCVDFYIEDQNSDLYLKTYNGDAIDYAWTCLPDGFYFLDMDTSYGTYEVKLNGTKIMEGGEEYGTGEDDQSLYFHVTTDPCVRVEILIDYDDLPGDTEYYIQKIGISSDYLGSYNDELLYAAVCLEEGFYYIDVIDAHGTVSMKATALNTDGIISTCQISLTLVHQYLFPNYSTLSKQTAIR